MVYCLLIPWEFSNLMSMELCEVWNTQVWYNAPGGEDLTKWLQDICVGEKDRKMVMLWENKTRRGTDRWKEK